MKEKYKDQIIEIASSWWANVIINKQIIRISGTMYYGTASIYIM